MRININIYLIGWGIRVKLNKRISQDMLGSAAVTNKPQYFSGFTSQKFTSCSCHSLRWGRWLSSKGAQDPGLFPNSSSDILEVFASWWREDSHWLSTGLASKRLCPFWLWPIGSKHVYIRVTAKNIRHTLKGHCLMDYLQNQEQGQEKAQGMVRHVRGTNSSIQVLDFQYLKLREGMWDGGWGRNK